ncbi:hypothetical protein [Cytobacillus praedii]|nr:hypothetical protein [Cytobacillus praedii]
MHFRKGSWQQEISCDKEKLRKERKCKSPKYEGKKAGALVSILISV